MYDKGQGVPQSDKEAVQWFKKAAEQGYADAQYNLGCMYANGRGVPQSDKEAAKWLHKAADQGYANAQRELDMLKAQHQEGAAQQAKTSSNAHPNASPAHLHACANCGTNVSNLRACSRCKATSYCSKECQTAHWKSEHKASCGK